MPRGGKRQGTQGKAYSNRTDLAVDYAAGGNPATGGMPTAPTQRGPLIGVDQVANLGDPTMRPDEPVTSGISLGAGPGPEALGPMPPAPGDPIKELVQALLLNNPNPDLLRVLNRLNYQGR